MICLDLVPGVDGPQVVLTWFLVWMVLNCSDLVPGVDGPQIVLEGMWRVGSHQGVDLHVRTVPDEGIMLILI